MISHYIVLGLVVALFGFAWAKKVRPYDSFLTGAKGGLVLVFDIFPFIMAIMVAVELFRVSGLATLLIGMCSPVFEALGMPTQIATFVFLRPFTGAGSLALLQDLILTYGPDSYVVRCAGVIMGSSETVFYVASVYFSKTSIKKLGIGIPIALLCALVGAILSCLLCKVM
jgi:spore maturation protein B